MKRLILTAAAVLCSTVTLWAQTAGSSPASTDSPHQPNRTTITISSTILVITRIITLASVQDVDGGELTLFASRSRSAGRHSQFAQPVPGLQSFIRPRIALDYMPKLGNAIIFLAQFDKS